jgi:acyl-coenzyme A thioesterase PaaI-like protein
MLGRSEPTDDPAKLAAAITGLVRGTVPVLGAIGMEIVEARPGHIRSRLPFKPENGNHIGTVYAGVLFSFLEASGGALVLVAFDVARYIPVIVEGTIRFARPVTGAVEADLSVTDAEREAVHAALEEDPRHRWTLQATAVAEDGTEACAAEFAYRFKRVPG